jgi:hypothetical protein
VKPDAGQIFIDGEEITGRDEAELQESRDKNCCRVSEREETFFLDGSSSSNRRGNGSAGLDCIFNVCAKTSVLHSESFNPIIGFRSLS